MPGWLTAIVKLIGLGDLLARWAHDAEERQVGIDKQCAADIAANNEVKDAELKAAVDRPADRDAVVDQLRSERF